jgi:S1-C subfamily serine protease
MYKLGTISIKGSLYVTVLCVGLWSLGSWVIESFKEKDTKWFFRKWFVLLNLFFLPPLGITLLWAGSKFRKPIKIALTVVFGLWFINGVLTRTTGSFHFSPEEEIASLIRVPKENIFIKPASYFVKTSFQDEILNKQIPQKKENLTIPQIVQEWGDSVVLVKSFGKEGEQIGLGSGFVITRKGGIITNYHVVESAFSVTIGLSNGKSYNNVSYITGDSSIDIVVLNIDAKDEILTPLIIGDSDNLQVGEQVLAIGNPYGWRNTLSDGLISGIREIEGLKLLQITAPISPGSSGGALFNMKGEVIGITTIASLWGAQNLNFAVPINSLKIFVENWKRK